MKDLLEAIKEDLHNFPMLMFYSLITTVSNYYIIGKITVLSFIFTFCLIFIGNVLLNTFVYSKLNKSN